VGGAVTRRFHKLLVANRGEIAVRILRTAHALGYATVAVHSQADADAPHVRLADEAVELGPPPAAQSYLSIERLLDAARRTGADALHPGYGFLSENADLATACADAGLVFVGPPAEAIRLMGNKRLARLAMQRAGVPCVPGVDGAEGAAQDQEDAALAREARRLGFPVMIKAAAGGGGRGMRLASREEELLEALRAARAEAEATFGSGELLLERAVAQARHVELQIFADVHGHTIHLGERDCSIQRRHQKLLEETPSPVVTPELRRRMGEAAVAAARACGYVGAGTVEFLLDAERRFFFLEMNTRLQVEHPVTELVTGLDLVAWQLDVAAGLPLPLGQEEVRPRGHAIEVRLCAEDPTQGFAPRTGVVHRWRPAAGPGVRIDAGLADGLEVGPHYDPLLAKLVAWGEDREQARRRLLRAVEKTVLLGLTSNRAFLARVLRNPRFVAGEATTGFLAEELARDPGLAARRSPPALVALGAVLLSSRERPAAGRSTPTGWRSAGRSVHGQRLRQGEAVLELSVDLSDAAAGRYRVTRGPGRGQAGGEERVELELLDDDGATCSFRAGGVRRRAEYVRLDDRLQLQAGLDELELQVEDATREPPAPPDRAHGGPVSAPMDGVVVALLVAAGDRVEAGQTLAVVEAMKMQHAVKAPVEGRVVRTLASEGAQVRARQVLVEVESSGGD
jgi:geranyl-CoA carboxylase alpha subunit